MKYSKSLKIRRKNSMTLLFVSNETVFFALFDSYLILINFPLFLFSIVLFWNDCKKSSILELPNETQTFLSKFLSGRIVLTLSQTTKTRSKRMKFSIFHGHWNLFSIFFPSTWPQKFRYLHHFFLSLPLIWQKFLWNLKIIKIKDA